MSFLLKETFFICYICYNLYKAPTIKIRCLERAIMEKPGENNLTTNDATQKNDKNASWINEIYKIRQEKTIKNISFKICKEIFYQ